MNRKVSVVLFWALIASAVVAFWRTVGEDPRGTLRTGAVVVPVVLLSLWFLSRFTGPRRRVATIMVVSALFAFDAGAAAVFKFELLRFFGNRTDLVEALIAVTLLAISASIAIWSFMRLRKLKVVN